MTGGVFIIGAGADLNPEILALLREHRSVVLVAERAEPVPLDVSLSDLAIRQMVATMTAPPIPYPAFPVYLGKRWPRRVAYRIEARPREQRTKRGKR